MNEISEPAAAEPDERPQRRREYSGAGSTLGVGLLIIAAVAVLIWYFEFRDGGTPEGISGEFGVVELADADNPTGEAPSAEPGRAAPNFTLETLEGGASTLTDWRGSYVLLNFWASWCGPCRGETPELEALWAEHGDSLTLVGVNIQETTGNAQEFVSDFDLTYPIVLDRDGEVTLAYRAKQPPTSVLVGPDGTVLKLYFGRLSSEELDALADEYLQ